MALFFDQNSTRNKLDKMYNIAHTNWGPFDKCQKLASTDAYCMVLVQHQLHQNVQFTRIWRKKLSLNMPTTLTIDTIDKYKIEIVNQVGAGGWLEE